MSYNSIIKTTPKLAKEQTEENGVKDQTEGGVFKIKGLRGKIKKLFGELKEIGQMAGFLNQNINISAAAVSGGEGGVLNRVLDDLCNGLVALCGLFHDRERNILPCNGGLGGDSGRDVHFGDSPSNFVHFIMMGVKAT